MLAEGDGCCAGWKQSTLMRLLPVASLTCAGSGALGSPTRPPASCASTTRCLPRWLLPLLHCWTEVSCTLISSATTACWSHCQVRLSGPGCRKLCRCLIPCPSSLESVEFALATKAPHPEPPLPPSSSSFCPAGVSESEFWSPSSERLPFRVVLADFGESKAFRCGAHLQPCALLLLDCCAASLHGTCITQQPLQLLQVVACLL
jgi:hypothetical protein